MYFSPQGEKIPKELLRLPPQTPIHLLGSIYPRLERCCSARKARTGHHSPCEKFVRLETPRPQAQTAGLHSPSVRRVPPWIARVYRVQTRAGSRRDAFSTRTNGQAGLPRFLKKSVEQKKEITAKIKMGIDQLSNCTIACGFFSFFSCTDKKRTRFSFAKEKNAPSKDGTFFYSFSGASSL